MVGEGRILRFLDRAKREAAQVTPRPTDPARASRPLHIVMVGWAKLSMQALEGAGLNLAVSELAAAMVRLGHQVTYLRCGMEYSVRRGMWIEPREIWRGVACLDFINSPNLATGFFNFYNVENQIAHAQQSAVVAEWVRGIGADVVHLHALEGLAFDAVEAIQATRAAVVVTPHNYFMLCPQVDLLRHERDVCADYQGGHACDGCLGVPDYQWEMRRRARLHSLRRMLTLPIYSAVKPAGRALAGAARSMLPARQVPIAGRPSPAPTQPVFAPGGDAPAHEQVVANRTLHLTVLNRFGERRRAGVAALARADLVLPPGAYLRRVHEAMGVPAEKMRHVRLAQPRFDDLRTLAAQSPRYTRVPWSVSTTRPLSLAYFGNCWVNKGLHILCDAFLKLAPDVSSRIRLNIHASGDDRAFRHKLRAFAQATFHGAYDEKTQARALEHADAGIFAGIALENSPFVILEMLSAGKFVIAPKRGAVLDFVREPASGVFFEPGDAGSLARTITRVVRGEVALPAPRDVHAATPHRSFPEHIAEMGEIYARLTEPLEVRTRGVEPVLAAAKTAR